MSKLKGINRRDFLSGMALTGAMFGLTPYEAMAKGLALPGGPLWTYPPERTGMRGDHKGSFEVAHAVAWQGKRYDRPKDVTDRPYDLIIVGGGISGLATAVMAQDKLGSRANILILDNHDDFGGHAKRNEFNVNGQSLIGYGGSQSLEAPGQYSKVSKAFIRRLGIDTEKFYRYFDQSFYTREGLGQGLYLDAEHYGKDMLFADPAQGLSGSIWRWDKPAEKARVEALIAGLPVSDAEKKALHHVLIGRPDWLTGMEASAKVSWLKARSFEACLQERAGLSAKVCGLFRNEVTSYWGVGWDALSGLEAVRLGHPLTVGLGLDPARMPEPYAEDEPYIFHFPDGNASVARLALAKLIPDALPDAKDMDSVVGARAHYDRLDRRENPVRVRLMSTAVDAHNTKDGVEVTYVRGGKAERVVARHAVMASWNHMLPFIMPDMPAAQKDALHYAEKAPLAYINIALRNWKPFADAGVARLYSPKALCASAMLDFPVSMGGYLFSRAPEDPILMHMAHIPTYPGHTMREQYNAGRHIMYEMSFDDYEKGVLAQLSGAFGRHGFDAEKHVAAITVNRWPHGYAYEYNELFDPPGYDRNHGPHVVGRQKVGNIAIANSDSSAAAFVNGAIDAAARAVTDLWG
ncbi:NAD(P)-binding protein [Kordiimonas marina]|uniref:NAD(P)-binding protein n=1 Tax=Kordiimonas marina TaxID=2872312 RepID=UPI001FF3FABC|nr:FAD/NAD(P)-binding protein [Kordiimonas marina]MCJ9429389.1 NAD(P)/FAD-dependent oxidoreductase [Kordiimonas marina]